MGGSAILEAAKKLLDVVRAVAATELGCAADEVARTAAQSRDGRTLSFGALAAKARQRQHRGRGDILEHQAHL